ncbi:hypothetical protein GWI33_002191 [Rhynchophorus ferrugineus]|uniref:FHA domain-containing protein n=1 Tax=Rhynchophorus ferrugineus TaxID=354439 RepID=A0A834IPM1_RHYFE|nr:hypothetical protein GWI33_002191 [Rhynchophorus ferrugineus]
MDQPSTSKSKCVPGLTDEGKPHRYQHKKLYAPEEVLELLFSGQSSSDEKFDSDSDSEESCDMAYQTSTQQGHPDDNRLDSNGWTWDDDGELKHIDFIGNPVHLNLDVNEPSDYFNLLATTEFYGLITTQTNKYAEELFLSGIEEHSRITLWRDVTENEFKIFLGLLYHTGTIKLNRLEDYWKTNYKFNIPVFRNFMPRNRFQCILRALHFADNPQNHEPKPVDSLYKIRDFIEFFNRRMSQVYYPGRNLSLDESMALWRGRSMSRQYITSKRRKYGIKLYMLTEPDGMVQKILVHKGAGNTEIGRKGHSSKVVLKLLEGKLNKGHCIYMDGFHNDISLAKDLLENGTYVTGKLRKNRKNIPVDVLVKKLNKGELVSKYSNGVSVQKWKDRRDILMVSTEHEGELLDTENRRGQHKMKPKSLVEYNKYMSGMDTLDQMLSYYSCDRETPRWDQKLGIHIFQCILINAFFLYNKNVTERMSFYDFRLKIIDYLLSHSKKETSKRTKYSTSKNTKRKSTDHCPQTIKKANKDGKDWSVRRKCKLCASNNKRKDTMYCCLDCENQPFLCLECFPIYHNKKK